MVEGLVFVALMGGFEREKIYERLCLEITGRRLRRRLGANLIMDERRLKVCL